MKRIMFMLMLTALTAIGAQAQVTMKYSSAGMVAGSYDTVNISSTNTYYFVTPLTSVNVATLGKGVISFSYTYASTAVFKAIIEGRVGADSNWTNVTKMNGTDGINCDTISIASATSTADWYNSATNGGWAFTINPGALKYDTYNSRVQYSAACRYTQYRLKIVNTSGTATIKNVKFIAQN
jgi:hypothetical protein